MKKILAFLLCAVMTLSVCVAAFPAHAADNCTDGITPGDVNGDGYIDAADALLCLRTSVGLITLTPEQEAAADVNHDGLVDAGDAILILRYDARLIPNLN